MPFSTSHSFPSDFRRVVLRGQMQKISGPVRRRAASVYGGAGDFGTRTESLYSYDSLTSSGGTAVITNEKLTLQNLNDRLSSYLQKVRTLEEVNSSLDQRIRQHYENKTSLVSSDFTRYFNIISELRAQILSKHIENQRIVLKTANAQLAFEDFRSKYETELQCHKLVMADVSCVRGFRDSLTLDIGELEFQVESLKEELTSLKLNHEEELQELKIQQIGAVNVEVDNAGSVDLTKALQEVREQYETVVQKKKLEIERWFKSKVETLQTQIVTHKTEVKASHTELSNVKKTYQALEIQLQSILTEIHCRKQNMEQINGQHGAQLTQLQMTINLLESELQQLRTSIEVQQTEYSLLLDIKMRLELEIAEYKRLLEGEHEQKVIEVVSQVEEKVEEHKPHIERRVKVITEELVDGVVVSSSSDTMVEEIQ